MRVALYTRVSTEDQAREGFSLEVQRTYLLQYAKNFGWDVFCSMSGRDVYMDDGYSGGNMDRPALQRLLFDARNKQFDLVLVYKQDRLSRRLKDLLGLLEEIDSLGVGYKSATEPFDTTSSAGKMAIQMLGSCAEFERNRLVERVFRVWLWVLNGGIGRERVTRRMAIVIIRKPRNWKSTPKKRKSSKKFSRCI